MMKLDWKIYSIIIGILLLVVTLLFFGKIFFFLIIFLTTTGMAAVLGFLQPLKYFGVELVTLSTMLVGVVYGPIIGGIYAFTVLPAHFMLGRYYMGTFLVWVIPEYVLLGVLSGILGTRIMGNLGLIFIVGINLIGLLLTFFAESDRIGKELPYVIGNTAINIILFTQFFNSIVKFMS